MKRRLADVRDLTKFREVVKGAYAKAKQRGSVPAEDVEQFDAAIAAPDTIRDRRGRIIQPWRLLRRRVTRMYRQHMRRSGQFDWNFDWEAIWEWVMDNIVPIMKTFLMLLPLFI